MQNKLYSTIANIFKEIKDARGNKTSLSEAISDGIKNQTEVLNSRGGFQDLNERLENFETKISDGVLVSENIKNKVDNININPTVIAPVVDIKGKDMFVSLENKMSYREDFLTIPSKEYKALQNVGGNNIYDSYIKTKNISTILKKYEFNTEQDVLFDSSINILSDKKITPKPTGELYEIPLKMSKIFHIEQLDAAILPNICTISCDYCTPTFNTDGTINYSNHLINVLRENEEWSINRSFLTVTIVFDRPTPFINFINRQSGNSTFCRTIISLSNDAITWNNVYSGNEEDINLQLSNEVTYKYVRYTYDIFDNLQTNYSLLIKKIGIRCQQYNICSEVVETIKPIPMYEYDSNMKIITTGITDNTNEVSTKFALNNVVDNLDKWSVYLPKLYDILPIDFYDNENIRFTGNELKNNLLVNCNSNIVIGNKIASKYTSTDISGELGNFNVGHNGRSGYHGYSVTDGWQLGEISFAKVFITLKGKEYTIPLNKNNINKQIEFKCDSYIIPLWISVLPNKTIRVQIPTFDANIILDNVKVEIWGEEFGIRSLNPGNSHELENCFTSAQANNKQIKNQLGLNVYDIKGQYQTGACFWNFDYRNPEQWDAAIINRGSCSILRQSNTSLTESVTTKVVPYMDNISYNVTTIAAPNCTLPISVYLSPNTSDQLYNVIENDITNISRIESTPVFVYKKEYKTKVFIGNKSEISKIVADQEARSDTILYSISFDDLNYFIFDKDDLEWATYFDKGMTATDLEFPNETFYNKIRNSEWLYIKVILDSPDAKLNKITVNFVDDCFVSIDQNEIYSKGMSKRHLESIDPNSLKSFLIEDYSILKIAQVAQSISPIYKYSLAGFEIRNYNEAQWERLDNTKVKEFLLPDNSVVYENISPDVQIVKVVRRLIENQVALIDKNIDTKSQIQEIIDKEVLIENNIKTLNQNVKLLHEGMLNNNVPSTLPTVMLPDIKEIDVPILKEGEFYKLQDIEVLRGIQVWEEQSSFKSYSEKLIFDKEHANALTRVGVTLNNNEAVVNSDYDRDNPYMLSESGNKVDNKKIVYPNFDLTLTVPPTEGDISAIMDNGGNKSTINRWDTNYETTGYSTWNAIDKYNKGYLYTCRWNLPGENIRMVDILLDFRHQVWVNHLSDVDFGIRAFFNSFYPNNYQITTFSYSIDGKEYIDIRKSTSMYQDQTIVFEKELRYIRVRLEIPYAHSRGADTVTFTEMNVWSAPVRYNHTGEFYVYNTNSIDTSKWLNFDNILVDRFVDHDPCEMKFLLSDDENHNTWKSWDGTKWVETTIISQVGAMSIETLLALRQDQLNKLTKGALYICAIMKTTDGHKTPVLRNIEFIHDLDTERYYKMVDLNTIDFKYSKVKKEIVITNDTTGDKKLKIVLL